MRKFILPAIILLVLICATLFAIYQYTGYKEYRESIKEVEKLSGDEKKEAYNILFGDDLGDEEYTGIIGWVNTYGSGGVLVWGKYGPRYFQSDENTIYSYFKVCNPEILEAVKNGESFSPGREMYTDIVKWSRVVEKGEYISLFKNIDESQGDVGLLREANATEWWPFIYADIVKLCQEKY